MELNNYYLDIVLSVEGGVQLKTYKISAGSAESAFTRWQDEDTTDFPIIYEGEIVPAIIVGISKA